MPATDIEIQDYRPVSRLRRLAIAGLAVATAAVIVLTLVGPPGAAKTKRAPPPDAPRCSEGQRTGCVGGTAQVITLQAPPASAAGR